MTKPTFLQIKPQNKKTINETKDNFKKKKIINQQKWTKFKNK